MSFEVDRVKRKKKKDRLSSFRGIRIGDVKGRRARQPPTLFIKMPTDTDGGGEKPNLFLPEKKKTLVTVVNLFPFKRRRIVKKRKDGICLNSILSFAAFVQIRFEFISRFFPHIS